MPEASLPFTGFYHSNHDGLIDQVLERDLEHLERELEIPESDIEAYAELYNDEMDWRAVFESYARSYAKAIENLFSDLPCANWGFKELWSPREYNFSTDRIFVEIPLADLEAIRRQTDDSVLEKLIKQNYTARSGFIPYYPNRLKDWPENLSDWEPAQLCTLLEAAIMTAQGSDNLDCLQPWELWDSPDEIAMDAVYAGMGEQTLKRWRELTEQPAQKESE